MENHSDIQNKELLKEHFWNMFIIDSLIGNYDRHNENWGILVNDEKQEMKVSPIYDCGSYLFS